VRLYSYFWHRDLWRIQEPNLREDMQRHDGKPAYINSALKRGLLDGGMSDASAYVGPAGGLVRAGVSSVLCRMARDAAGLRPRPNTAWRPAATCRRPATCSSASSPTAWGAGCCTTCWRRARRAGGSSRRRSDRRGPC